MPEFEEIKKPTTDSKLPPLPTQGTNLPLDEKVIPKADVLNPIKKEDYMLGNKSKSDDPYADFPDKSKTFRLRDEDICKSFLDGPESKIDFLIRFESIRDKNLYPEGIEISDPYLTELFPHEPCLDDIKQGKLGECAFLALITSMINKDPLEIKRMIRDNKDGTATVRLFDDCGRAEYYTVDISSAIYDDAYEDYELSKEDYEYNPKYSFDKFKIGKSNIYPFTGEAHPVLWLEVLRKAYMCFRTRHQDKKQIWRDCIERTAQKDAERYISIVQKNILRDKDKGFFAIVSTLMREILCDFFLCLEKGKDPGFNHGNYKELYDVLKSSSEFYVPEKSAELTEEKIKKGKENFQKKLEELYSSLQKKIDKDKILQWTESKQAELIVKDIEKSRELLSDLINPLKEIVGQSYLDRIMLMIPAKICYGVLYAGESSDRKNLFNLSESLVSEEIGMVRLNREFARLDSDGVKNKSKFPLSKDRNYDDEILNVYDYIKEYLRKGELLFATFKKRKSFNKNRKDEEGSYKGLYSGHAYSILGVGEKVFPSIEGGSKTIKTIIIRNPHGKTGRQYEAKIGDKTIRDIFEDTEAMKVLKNFSSVKAASTEKAQGNFSIPRKFHDLARGKDIEGSGIFEMELSDFVDHFCN